MWGTINSTFFLKSFYLWRLTRVKRVEFRAAFEFPSSFSELLRAALEELLMDGHERREREKRRLTGKYYQIPTLQVSYADKLSPLSPDVTDPREILRRWSPNLQRAGPMEKWKGGWASAATYFYSWLASRLYRDSKLWMIAGLYNVSTQVIGDICMRVLFFREAGEKVILFIFL